MFLSFYSFSPKPYFSFSSNSLRSILSWVFNLRFQNGLKWVLRSKCFIDRQKAMFGNLNHGNHLLGYHILFITHYYLTLPKTSYWDLDLDFILSFNRWTELVLAFFVVPILVSTAKTLRIKLEVWYGRRWLLHISFLRTSYSSCNWSCCFEKLKIDGSKRVVREKNRRRWIAGW